MSIEWEKDYSEQINAVATTVSLFLTGTFILSEFGIPPILYTGYRILSGGTFIPGYFTLALGISGTYSIIYNLAGVLFIQPIECIGQRDFIPQPKVGSLASADIGGAVVLFVVYLIVADLRGIIWSSEVIIGGGVIMLLTPVYNIIPRAVAERVDYDCFFGIKVLLISLPLSVIVFSPVIILSELL